MDARSRPGLRAGAAALALLLATSGLGGQRVARAQPPATTATAEGERLVLKRPEPMLRATGRRLAQVYPGYGQPQPAPPPPPGYSPPPPPGYSPPPGYTPPAPPPPPPYPSVTPVYEHRAPREADGLRILGTLVLTTGSLMLVSGFVTVAVAAASNSAGAYRDTLGEYANDGATNILRQRVGWGRVGSGGALMIGGAVMLAVFQGARHRAVAKTRQRRRARLVVGPGTLGVDGRF